MELPRYNGIEYYPFAVDTTPRCVWDPHLSSANAQLLDSIDPKYFEHVAESATTLEDGEPDKYAATTLRLTYSHALETLFSLLAAFTQAAQCPLGWLLAYRTDQLVSIVKKIDAGRGGFPTVMKGVPTWAFLAEAIHAPIPDPELRAALIEGFGQTWARFAHDFVSESFAEEYNALKHGFGSMLGGFTISISAKAPITTTGESTWTAGNKHGSTFYRRQRLTPRHFALRMHGMNWLPSALAARLELTAMSIHNVLAALKQSAGAKEISLRYPTPHDRDAFQLGWRNLPSISTVAFGETVELAHIRDFTSDDILSVYRDARLFSNAGDE